MFRHALHALAGLILLAASGARALPPGGVINPPPAIGGICTRFPEICVPPGGVLDPGTEPTPPQANLSGTGKLRAGGITQLAPYPAALVVDTNSLTFSLFDGDGTLFTGNLVAKGSKGNRFLLFLDGGSRDAFKNKLATRAGTMTGHSAGSVLGETLRLELTLDEASARLKVKCNVLTSGLGEVVFKANLVGDITL
jgi:hypothetical protein